MVKHNFLVKTIYMLFNTNN